ncbi:M23 family metallopeptidase [Candidatus Binatus soli]|jgi:hypothetical protein|uniref:M23 family metallopeptidase n=1 Tax=Candidatus Binatus soli TaxID=1953413 RepID=UPI003D0DBC6D
MYRIRLLLLATITSLAFVGSSFAEQKPPPPAPENDPLYMRVVATPYPPEAQILDGADHPHSAYELYVTNFGKTPLKITKLDVQGKDDNEVVVTQSASGKQLAAMFVPATGADASKPNDPVLKPGETGVFFIFADWIPDQSDPDTFDTAITIQQHGERSGSGTIHAAELNINQDNPIVIRSPLRGINWLAVNGPSNTSAHRRAMLPVNGQPHIGQRYAIDWIQLGGDGKSFTGDEHKNSSYHAWDQEIRAVANGTIAEVKDGILENVPNSGKTAVPISYETLAGNYIIEDLGDDHFAAYAHLRPGTLKVKAHDTVHAGDVLAHLGNTGNSSEPHLHFQVCDAASLPASEGLPFAINQFTLDDYKIDKAHKGHQALIVKSSHPMTKQEPMENELDSF